MKNQHNYFISGRDGQFVLDSDYATDEYDLFVNSCGIDCYTGLKKNYVMSRKSGRKDYLLLYIEEGSCVFEHNGKRNSVNENSIVLFRPEESQFYSYAMENTTRVFWVHFTGRKVEEVLKSCNLDTSFAHLNFKPSHLESTIYNIIAEFKRPTEFYRAICSSYLNIFLSYIGDALCNNKQKNVVNERLLEVAKDILTTYDQNLPIEYYADIYGCSVNQFTIIFKENFGCTPRAYITQQRLNTAENLLLNSNFSIKKIAESIGYEDPLYFSRIFKKKYGYSPREFKDLYTL
ncbi:MAG: helix-turn-helix transcriptional regulator [Clostridia bacterium]|nr:helix-turn-helix transcriptional regulator [Clostridia bacterium]